MAHINRESLRRSAVTSQRSELSRMYFTSVAVWPLKHEVLSNGHLQNTIVELLLWRAIAPATTPRKSTDVSNTKAYGASDDKETSRQKALLMRSALMVPVRPNSLVRLSRTLAKHKEIRQGYGKLAGEQSGVVYRELEL